jgi:hypothetical protein
MRECGESRNGASRSGVELTTVGSPVLYSNVQATELSGGFISTPANYRTQASRLVCLKM